LLILILLCNTIVNVAAASTAAIVAIRLAEKASYPHAEALFLSIEIILMTILVLFWGEITPKLIAYRSPIKIAIAGSFFLEILHYIFWPIIKIIDLIGSIFSKDKEMKYYSLITQEDFKHFIQSKAVEESFEEKEKNMLDSIFTFSSTLVKDIMVPRVDITALDKSEDLEKLKDTIQEFGYSRIPIYDKNIDNIIGLVYAKDVLLSENKKTITSLLRPAFFIPPNMKIKHLLNQFKNKKLHIAIIVDEYGGTSGLITLEDILEELVGDIMDEYDQEDPVITKLKDDEYILDGMCSIPDLNQLFDLSIDKTKYDNLADFLYDRFNKVPAKNESLTFENFIKFTVTNVIAQRILTVRVKKMSSHEKSK